MHIGGYREMTTAPANDTLGLTAKRKGKKEKKALYLPRSFTTHSSDVKEQDQLGLKIHVKQVYCYPLLTLPPSPTKYRATLATAYFSQLKSPVL